MQPPFPNYKVHYNKCQKQGSHKGEDLNVLCLGKMCGKVPICSICREEEHSKHQTMPIKYLLEDVVKQVQKEVGERVGVAQRVKERRS